MFVIGTAGHVDHGKSTLIEALTGIDPDRLREEKERGMTIELGFAWLKLPDGREVSVVDVPGHERFIRHMLMGVGGIDLALLTVAADEGVMPQTREHLAILDLLRIERGIVAVTKRDLVEPDWLELVSVEITEALEGTSLEGAPMVPVSATTGEGLDDLVAEIEAALADMPEKRDLGRPRLPVDRSFVISGFGTVVTGTLVDGVLRTGQEVELLPGGLRGRVRGLQTHQTAVDEAAPGTRVAVNISGVSHDQVSRGDVLTIPGWLAAVDAIDVSLRMVPGAPRALRHNASVTFHAGAAETPARVRLLAADRLEPGETGWAQIRLQAPMPVVKGDFFVVRDSMVTLGGGVVVEPGARRHRRFHERTLDRLAVLERGSEREVVLSALGASEPTTVASLARAANLTERSLRQHLSGLEGEGLALALGDGGGGVYYSSEGWAALAGRAREALAGYHSQHPLRAGMPLEELRSRLGLSAAVFNLAVQRLDGESVLSQAASSVRLPGHAPDLDDRQRREVDAYLEALGTDRYSPPTDRPLDPELLGVLTDEGRVVRANEDVVFLRSAYDEMVERVVEKAREAGQVSIADVRDMFG
ncbi:MAG: selenocysteine-specific translation elongation factor, partial [Dehalococcoidia bacterium]